MKSYETMRFCVIDSDPSSQGITASVLARIGSEEITYFHEGELALEALSNSKYDCVILDWTLKGLGALAVLTRLRRLDFCQHIPVLILVGGNQLRDFRLLTEYPCTEFLAKPISLNSTKTALIKVQREREWYEDHAVALRDALELNQADSGLRKLEGLIKAASNPTALSLMAARLYENSGNYMAAKQLYTSALEHDEKSVLAMSGLAAQMVRDGQNREALALLTRAQKLSPHNIQRLCQLGEVSLNLNEPEPAIANFQKALAIDPKDPKAKIGQEISKNFSVYSQLYRIGDNTPSLARFLNNVGVIMVRAGKIQEGMKHYFYSYSFLNDLDLKVRVSFNIGIGYKRWQKLDNAKKWLEQSNRLSQGKFIKSRNLLIKIGHVDKGSHSTSMPIRASGGDLEIDDHQEHLMASTESVLSEIRDMGQNTKP